MTDINPAAQALGITDIEKKIDVLTSLVQQLLQETRPLEYTPAQVAHEIGVSERTIKRRVDALKAQGLIQAGSRMVPRDMIDKLRKRP